MKTIDEFGISEFNLFCYSLSKRFRGIRIGTDWGYIDATFDYAWIPTDKTPYFVEYSHGIVPKHVKVDFLFGDLLGVDGNENQITFFLKYAEITFTKSGSNPLHIRTIPYEANNPKIPEQTS